MKLDIATRGKVLKKRSAEAERKGNSSALREIPRKPSISRGRECLRYAAQRRLRRAAAAQLPHQTKIPTTRVGEAGYRYAGESFQKTFRRGGGKREYLRVTRDTAEAEYLEGKRVPAVCGTASASRAAAVQLPHQTKIPTLVVGIFVWWGKLDSDQRSQ